MAIERLSFPKHLKMEQGVELESDDLATLSSQVNGLLSRFGMHSERLTEGNYDLTPQIWQPSVYKAELTVMRSGSGLVRMIPLDVYATTRVLGRDGLKEPVHGGRVIKLPEDIPCFMLLGPNEDRQSTHLYELIFHHPVPNPKQGRFTV